jgi:hypothetical protein
MGGLTASGISDNRANSFELLLQLPTGKLAWLHEQHDDMGEINANLA